MGLITYKNIFNWRKKQIPPITLKKVLKVDPALLKDETKMHHLSHIRKWKSTPWNRRVYYDQSVKWLIPRVNTKGKAPSGKVLIDSSPTKAPTDTAGDVEGKGRAILHLAVRGPARRGRGHTKGHVVAWKVEGKNYTNLTIQSFIKKKLIKNLKPTDNFFLDRWGLGRPRADGSPGRGGHNHPIVRRLIEKNCASHNLLPVKGCWVDPVEVVFNFWKKDLKKEHRKYIHGVIDVNAIRRATKKWMREKAPKYITSGFKQRADGQKAIELGLF